MLYIDIFLICFGLILTFSFINVSFESIEKIKTGFFIEVDRKYIITAFVLTCITLLFTIRFAQLVIGN